MLFFRGGHSKGGGRLLSKGGRGRGHSKGVEGGVFLNGGGCCSRGGSFKRGGVR